MRHRQWPGVAPVFQCVPEAHLQWPVSGPAFLLAYDFWIAVFECLTPPAQEARISLHKEIRQMSC